MAVLLYPDAGPLRVLAATDTIGVFSVQNNNGGRYAVFVRGKPSATTMYLEIDLAGRWTVLDEITDDLLTDANADGIYEGAVPFWLSAGSYRVRASAPGPQAYAAAITVQGP